VTPCQKVVGALEARGSKFVAPNWQCPAHEDDKGSLNVAEARDGTVLCKCYAGCSFQDISSALGLAPEDFFPKRTKSRPIDMGKRGKRVARYVYTDPEGKAAHWTDRLEPKSFTQGHWAPNGHEIIGLSSGWYVFERSKWFPCKDGGQGGRHMRDREEEPPESLGARWWDAPTLYLYRLPAVIEAVKGYGVWLVEGEKDVEALEKLGAVATCPPMGNKWRDEYTQVLRGATVSIVRDKDGPEKKFAGQKHAATVAEALTKAGCTVRVFQAAEGKDASDHLAAGLGIGELVLVEEWRDFEGKPVLRVEEGGGEPPPRTPSPAAADPTWLHQWRMTEVGMAERLAAEHEGEMRFVTLLNAWLVWDGLTWRLDKTKGAPMQSRLVQLVRKVHAGYKERLDAALDIEAAKVAEGGCKAAIGFESGSKISSVLGIAERLPGIPIEPEQLDVRQDVIVCANAQVDLRTGLKIEPRRTDFITKRLAVDFDPEADCPLWSSFVERCVFGDAEMYRFLMKCAGYSLTGLTSEQVCMFLYGDGQTGKSRFVETLEHIMGPYATKLMPSRLMVRHNDDDIPTHLAKLRGMRFVKVPEVGEGTRFDESLVKILTGEANMSARFMRENEFDMDIRFKLWMYGNSKPKVSGTDNGIWRRFVMVPFENVIPKEERDLDFGEKLKQEAPGVLQWMLHGARLWFDEGLEPPRQVVDAVKEYREEMDQVAQFVADALQWHEEGLAEYVRAIDMYKAYRKWCEVKGEKYVMREKLFQPELSRKDGMQKKRVAEGWRYLNVSVHDDYIDRALWR
jgi:putative DNA primase/helicase